MNKHKVVFEFDSEELKEDFLGWMSDGGGEQDFYPRTGGYAKFRYLVDEVIITQHKDESDED